MSLTGKTIYELKNLLATKEVTAKEITSEHIKQIEKSKDTTQTFITNTFEKALEKAKKTDEKISKGEPLKNLEGIPYGLKDNICTKGIKTTCSSKLLENFISPYSASVYNKLEESGAVLLGKLDMDEFAMGSSNENSSFNTVRNPHDLSTVPGGSSGASAASVANNEVSFALGSDTGGSIRMPASFCGVTGLKPTYGRVSRYGLVAFASSLDQIGPLCKDARDAAIILNSISGYDENDSTSLNHKVPDYTKALTTGLKGLKIGFDMSLLEKGISEDIKNGILEALEVFKSLGGEIIDISFKYMDYVIPAYYLISSSEASSNLSRFDGVRYGVRKEGDTLEEIILNTRTEGFGEEVKRRMMIGTFCLSAGYYDMYYNKALKVRRLIKEEYDEIFLSCDLILSPTTPTTAFKIGEKNEDPLTMYLSDIYTVTANLTGIPAMSIPCGFDKNNLPIGLQLSANVFKEEVLLKAAYNYQGVTKHHKKNVAL